MSGDAISATQADMREPKPKPTADELQDFFSGLLHIQESRGFKSGWAFHSFCEKFGFQPEGLHWLPKTPSKIVWGWVNRRAIKRSRAK